MGAKRRAIDLQEKLSIIAEAENVNRHQLAKNHKVNRSVIIRTLKKKKKFWKQSRMA
jgi:hypothetical protein